MLRNNFEFPNITNNIVNHIDFLKITKNVEEHPKTFVQRLFLLTTVISVNKV